MDKDRIRRSAMGGGTASNASRRLLVYMVAIVALLVYWIVWGGGIQSPEPPAIPESAPDERQAEPLAKVDVERLADVRDTTRTERATLEPDATGHLLDQSARLLWGDLEQLGLERADWEELVERGAEHRGRPFWTLGTLAWVERLPPGPFAYAVRGEVVGEDGRSWNMVVVNEPLDLVPGDFVKLAGFFLKHYDMPRPDRSVSSGPLIVGNELLRSAPRIEPVMSLRPDLFARVHDQGLGESSRPVEGPEFYEALSYIRHAPEDVVFPPDQEIIEYRASDLREHSESFRGQVVRVSGTLAWAEKIPLGPRGENPLGIPFIWKLWLTSPWGPALVYTFDEPGDIRLRQDIADADGLYFRRYSYENSRGQAQIAAVVLARRVTRFEVQPNEWLPVVIKITIGIVIIVCILLYLGNRRDREDEQAARKKRMERQKRRTTRRDDRDAGPDPAAAGGVSPTS
ncbi:MAG: hypothetical protein ACYTG2_16020 [Planctomycetota bacterium]|jgi:hypothetical protein